MGCIPSSVKKQKTISSQLTEKGAPDASIIGMGEKLNKSEIIIDAEMAVKGSNEDPYKKYTTLKKTLGEGAFGKVEKVQHNISKEIRAMKIIHIDKINIRNKKEEEELYKEINILKTLDHPNIMKIFEYYTYNNCLYIISEFLSGGELFDKISENKNFKEDVCSFLMKQIFSAVDFCHEKEIIHRDLKPENILIESEEEARKEFFNIKLIDFGTSDKIKKGQYLKQTVGTPYYTAPEVLEQNYNLKCDLWSCGVIMYLMLSGKQPFEGKDDEEIENNIKQGKIDFNDPVWDYISNDAKDLIKKLLNIKVDKRYTAKQALNHPWIIKSKNRIQIDKNKFAEIVQNLRNYKVTLKIQQSVLAYIVHNLVPKEDCYYLKQVFIAIDENSDGKLTKEELIKGLNIILDQKEAEEEVNRLFEIIDVDGNGFIEYEEFLRAGLDKKKILTENNLKMAFKLYDTENKGKINADDLKKILGKGADNVDDNKWQGLIDEADFDKDGEINYQDFKRIMNMC